MAPTLQLPLYHKVVLVAAFMASNASMAVGRSRAGPTSTTSSGSAGAASLSGPASDSIEDERGPRPAQLDVILGIADSLFADKLSHTKNSGLQLQVVVLEALCALLAIGLVQQLHDSTEQKPLTHRTLYVCNLEEGHTLAVAKSIGVDLTAWMYH
jgi:hypothetical protein